MAVHEVKCPRCGGVWSVDYGLAKSAEHGNLPCGRCLRDDEEVYLKRVWPVPNTPVENQVRLFDQVSNDIEKVLDQPDPESGTTWAA